MGAQLRAQRVRSVPRGVRVGRAWLGASLVCATALGRGASDAGLQFRRRGMAVVRRDMDGVPAGLRVRGGGGGGDAAHLPAPRPLAAPAVALTGGKYATRHEHQGHMSVLVAVLNMLADLCPHGMLPMAYGVAAMGGTGLAPAALVTTLASCCSGYTLFSLGRSYQASGCSTDEPPSLRAVWSAVIGEKSAWMASSLVALLCAGCCVFYSAFIGDLFTAVAQTLFPKMELGRSFCLGMLTLCLLLPLCLMSDLSALQYSSVGGLGGILFVVAFVIIRFFDGSYEEGGKFYKYVDDALHPFPSGLGMWSVGPGMMVMMNMCVVAFLIHYNGVKYMVELKHHTNANYRKAISFAMFGSLSVFLCMMVFGSKTFGLHALPLILNNYCKSEDYLATIARVATGVAILSGYPLMFAGLKEGAFPLAASAADALGAPSIAESLRTDTSESDSVFGTTFAQGSVAVAILALITKVAFNVSEEDVGLVLGIVGAVLGSQLAYVVPALLNLKLFAQGKIILSNKSWEPALNRFLLCFGAFFACFGTFATLKEHQGHVHDH